MWYAAEVTAFTPKTGKHELRYLDDHIVEKLHLADEKWRRAGVDDGGAGAAGRDSVSQGAAKSDA